MKISNIPNMPDEFKLVLFGDNQAGNKAMATDKFLECTDFIMSNKKTYGVHMGDLLDAFWIDDYRYDPTTTTMTPIDAKKMMIGYLKPLAKSKKLLKIIKGNHERALEKKAGDIIEDVCSELRKESGCQYPITGLYNNKLQFYDSNNRLISKTYLTHGRKTIQSTSPDPHRRKAYMQFRLKRLLENQAGDCILMARGHSHIVLVTPPMPTLWLDTDKTGEIKQHYTKPGTGKSAGYIHPDHRWYGCTGSFLKSQLINAETYSEVAEYEPVELGYLIATFANRTCVDLEEVKI